MNGDYLECNGTFLECPICNASQTSYHEWPEAGTHAFTIPYKCGSEIDYPIGSDGCVWGVKCDGSLKRFEMPDFKNLSEEDRDILKKILKK